MDFGNSGNTNTNTIIWANYLNNPNICGNTELNNLLTLYKFYTSFLQARIGGHDFADAKSVIRKYSIPPVGDVSFGCILLATGFFNSAKVFTKSIFVKLRTTMPATTDKIIFIFIWELIFESSFSLKSVMESTGQGNLPFMNNAHQCMTETTFYKCDWTKSSKL